MAFSQTNISPQKENPHTDLHKCKKFLLNANNNRHSFQVGCKMVSLNNLNSVTTSPAVKNKTSKFRMLQRNYDSNTDVEESSSLQHNNSVLFHHHILYTTEGLKV